MLSFRPHVYLVKLLRAVIPQDNDMNDATRPRFPLELIWTHVRAEGNL